MGTLYQFTLNASFNDHFAPVHRLLPKGPLLHFPRENVTGTRKFRGTCCTFASKA